MCNNPKSPFCPKNKMARARRSRKRGPSRKSRVVSVARVKGSPSKVRVSYYSGGKKKTSTKKITGAVKAARRRRGGRRRRR